MFEASMDLDGNLIPFTLLDSYYLRMIASGGVPFKLVAGDLPDAGEIGRSIAAALLRERGA